MTIRSFLAQHGPRRCVSCHRSGLVTYWCPLNQVWVENAATIPPHALVVLSADEEARVRRHLERHGVYLP